ALSTGLTRSGSSRRKLNPTGSALRGGVRHPATLCEAESWRERERRDSTKARLYVLSPHRVRRRGCAPNAASSFEILSLFLISCAGRRESGRPSSRLGT